MGVMEFRMLGLATAIPPTAEVTETAGVKTPSAMVRPVPNNAWTDVGESSREVKSPDVAALAHSRTHGSRNHLIPASFSADDLVESALMSRQPAGEPAYSSQRQALKLSGLALAYLTFQTFGEFL